jgi:hypothetical protein
MNDAPTGCLNVPVNFSFAEAEETPTRATQSVRDDDRPTPLGIPTMEFESPVKK